MTRGNRRRRVPSEEAMRIIMLICSMSPYETSVQPTKERPLPWTTQSFAKLYFYIHIQDKPADSPFPEKHDLHHRDPVTHASSKDDTGPIRENGGRKPGLTSQHHGTQSANSARRLVMRCVSHTSFGQVSGRVTGIPR